MSKKPAAVFVGIISNIIFGFSFIFTKDALETLGVSNIVFLSHRFMLASAIMAAIALIRRQRFSFKGRPWHKLVLLGLCQPVIYFLAANYGLLQSTSTFSAVIIALVPVVATMEAMVFLKERPTWIQTVLCLLSVSAVVVMSYSDANSGNTTVWGVALLVVSSVAAGTFNLISRESREQFTPFERTFAMFVVAAITFTVLALVETRSALQLMVQPLFKSSYIVDLLYLGGLSSVVGFFGVNYANTYLPVVQATAFSNITTIVSVMAGIFILREPFTWVTIPAALVIMTSVWGIQKFDRRESHAQEA